MKNIHSKVIPLSTGKDSVCSLLKRMVESETDNNSMVAVDNGRTGEARAARSAHRNDDDDEQLPTERNGFRSRFHDGLVNISSLAVPLLIVTLLLFPAIIVVVILVGICLVPSILVLCVGCMLYIFCPETSSTFALLWGSGGSQRRWDMDWTLTNYMETLEPRSREDLETALTIKTVVEGNPSDETDIDVKAGQGVKSSGEDETKMSGSHDDDQDETITCSVDKEGASEGTDEVEPDIETGKIAEEPISPKRKPLVDVDFDPKTMIYLHHISQSCCDICMMDYEPDDKISESKNSGCDHIFHKDCILDWMQKKHTCPCCRRNYLGEEDDQENVATPGWRENL